MSAAGSEVETQEWGGLSRGARFGGFVETLAEGGEWFAEPAMLGGVRQVGS
jgi:hypothetical protein